MNHASTNLLRLLLIVPSWPSARLATAACRRLGLAQGPVRRRRHAAQAAAARASKGRRIASSTSRSNESVVVGKDNALVECRRLLCARPTARRSKSIPTTRPSSRSRSCSTTRAARSIRTSSLVRTGQPFNIKNSDPVGHNTNIAIESCSTKRFAAGEEQIKTFSQGRSAAACRSIATSIRS